MKTKSNIWIYALAFMGASLMFASSCDDDNDDPVDVTSPVILNEIEDYGYSYAVCKGTFKHNNDTALSLDRIYYSDITNKPTLTNSYSWIRPYIIGDTLGQIEFGCRLGLRNNTTYYIRCAYTKNKTDTLYSNVVSVTTLLFEINSIEFNPELTYGQVSDIENNTYKTIEIGTQTWMAENLKTTKFNNGTSIPLSTYSSEFLITTDPEYCNFNNDEGDSGPLGKLYNWYVIEEQNVCPSGWHVATTSDWDILDEYVTQNYMFVGKALASKSGWMESRSSSLIGNDLELNDSTGFSAIAAGEFSLEEFRSLGHAAVWWSPNDENGNYLPSSRYLTRDTQGLGVNITEKENNGYSVRCVKN